MSHTEITNLLTKNIFIFDESQQLWKLYIIDNQWIEFEIEQNEALEIKLATLAQYRFSYTLIQKIGQSGIHDETFLNTLQRLKFSENLNIELDKIRAPSFLLPILRVLVQ
jgi:hypothetical protein